jgi:hypothetical protein
MAARVIEIAFLGSTAQLEASLVKAGLVAKESGNVIGDSFAAGSSKAGGAIDKLGKKGEQLGIPFVGSLGKVGKAFDDVDTKGQHFARTMSTIGGATLLGVGAAIAGVSAESVKLALNFQKSVASIAGNADITVAQAKKIGDAFLGTAGYMTMSGNEMAAAFAPVAGQLKQTEGAALTTAQSLSFMKVAADLAEGSQTDLGTATAALSQVMQSFHFSVQQAGQASDTLFNVSRALNVPITTVAAAVDKLHGRLGIMMPSLSDVSALMISLGQHGIIGSRGIQVAQTALATLVGGSTKTTQTLNEMGIQTSELYGPKGFLGMQNAIDVLRPKLEGLTADSQKNALLALFGTSAWQVMGQIVAGGAPKFQQATDAANKMGTAHKAAAEQAKTLAGEMKILVASLEDIATKLGEVLIPVLQQFGSALANTINWMEQHKAVAEALAAAIAGPLALAVGFFAEQKAVKFANSVKGMVGELQKLGSWIAGNAATMGSSLEGIGTSGETAGANVATGMSTAETAVIDAETPLATAAAADGAAIEKGFAVSGELGVGGAIAGAEGTMVAAEPELQATGEADGAAISRGWALGLAGAAAATAALVAGDQGPTKTYALHPPGFPQVTAPNTGEAESAYLKATLGLPKDYKGGPISASSYKGAGVDMASVEAFFKWLSQQGSFSGGGFVPSTTAAGTAQQKASQAETNKALKTYGTVTAASFATSANWANTLLAAMGVKSSPGAVTALEDFQAREGPFGTQAAYNPLNVSGPLPGTGKFDGTPAENYGSPGGGIQGELAYFQTYGPGVIAALKTGNVANVEAAVRSLGPNAFGNDTDTPWAGSATSVPSGTQTLPTGNKTIGSPATIAAQTTIAGVNTTLSAAIERYQSAAKTAKDPAIEKLDHDLVTQLQGLKATFDKQTSGLAGQPLTLLIDALKKNVTSAEQHTGTAVKNATTFETLRTELQKQEDKYKSAAQSAATPLLAKLDSQTAALITHLDSGFHSVSQDVTTKQLLDKIDSEAKARVKIATVAGTYSTAAKSATTPALAQLDNYFAQLLGGYATAKTIPGGGVVGRAEQRAKVVTALGGRGSSELGTIQQMLQGGSFTDLEQLTQGRKTATSHSLGLPGGATLVTQQQSEANAQFTQLVTELKGSGNAILEKMGDQLVSYFKQAETAKNSLITADNKNMLAAQTTKVTADMHDTAAGMLQATKDAMQTLTDQWNAMVTAITDATQAAADAASGQSTAISDAAQATVDQLGERGLYGLNLVAQQMQVAADNQKTGLDAQITAAQQAVDTAQASGDNAQAAQTAIVDAVTAQQNALIAQAQSNLDAVTGQQNVLVQSAQTAVDQGKAGSQAALQAAQGTAAAQEAAAQQALTQAQDAANAAEAQAQSALANANGQASVVVAQAQQALGQAQDQAQVAEAQSQAQIAIEKEMAQTQFAGTGLTVNIYGDIPITDAAAVSSELSWVGRTQFSAPMAA